MDLVADHKLTNAIRPQINSFLEGFNELVPQELISIFNDKELELLISGLPEIDCELDFLFIFKTSFLVEFLFYSSCISHISKIVFLSLQWMI